MFKWLKRRATGSTSRAESFEPLVPDWRPTVPQPIDKIAERVRYYTDGKRDFALLRHGTCVLLDKDLERSAAEQSAKNVLQKILMFHPDMNPLRMDDGNLVVQYNGPAFNVVLKEISQEHSIEIERRFEEALVKSEVLFTNLGPNRFDAIGKVALFGRCFMFMDAQDPSVVLIERRTCES